MTAEQKCPLPTEEKQALAMRFSMQIRRIAARSLATLPRHVEREDLLHDGIVGLMEALHRFDAARGVAVYTYASCRIRGSITDSLRQLDWMSRGARHRARELAKAEDRLSQQLKRTPSNSELSATTGLTRAEIDRRRHESLLGYLSSLDEVHCHDDGTEETYRDSLADAQSDVNEAAYQSECLGALREVLATLSPREQSVLRMYYLERHKIAHISEQLGVSEARVSQIHRRSLDKLKAELALRGIR